MQLIALIFGALVSTTTAATSHDWYTPACCSGIDCAPISDDSISELPDGRGYYVVVSGEIIPYESPVIKGNSPDGRWHRCTLAGPGAAAETRCLWTKGGGV